MTLIQNILQSFYSSNPVQFKGTVSNISAFKPLKTSLGDGFVTNPLSNPYSSDKEIEAVAKSNPRINEIAKKYGFKIKANDCLEDLKKNHLQKTRVVAAKIYSQLPIELKDNVNLPDVQQAAMLHDYGKVLIPSKILNKEGALTEEEREIMNQHSELGYELLKSKGYNENVLNLVKYHQQSKSGDGYPAYDNNYKYNLELEILKAADEYCALTESRCYKSAFSPKEALKILEDKVLGGDISEEVFTALQKSV